MNTSISSGNKPEATLDGGLASGEPSMLRAALFVAARAGPAGRAEWALPLDSWVLSSPAASSGRSATAAASAAGFFQQNTDRKSEFRQHLPTFRKYFRCLIEHVGISLLEIRGPFDSRKVEW